MNNIQHQLAVKNAVQSKFKNNSGLASTRKPNYPSSAEREFERLINKYMKIYKRTLKKHLPYIMQICKQSRNDSMNFDDNDGFDEKLSNEFIEINKELEQALNEFGLDEFVMKVGNMTKSTSLKEWKKCVKNTLGIDILDDYYKGDFYAQQLRLWVENNVSYIKSIPNDSLFEMKTVILDSYKTGKPLKAIQQDIQDRFDVSKNKAKALAKDQIGTLTAEIAKEQQKDAGCNKYIWSSSKDGRVRECHEELDGEVISWDEPPEMWYETKNGIVFTGRRCHPGEDYGCRCVAIPYFEIDTLNIPMK